MKIQTETVDYAPAIPSHPWATADRDVYTSGDLVPKGYERTFIDTGCVPVDDDGALIRMDMYTSIGPAGAMATTDISATFESCGVEDAYMVAAAYALAAATVQADCPEPGIEQVRMLAATIRGQARDIMGGAA